MKQFKTIIVGIFILLSTGLYANTVNMAPIISYLLSDTATPQEIAIDKIKAYAGDETQPAPTVEDYEDAGVVGATSANIDIINNAVVTLTPEEVDTTEEIQQVLLALGINMPPIADAGPDKNIEIGNAAYPRGSGSDEDGEIVSYAWTENGVVIATEAEFLYIPAAVGTVTLTLTVTDDDGATGSDSMNVTTQDTVAPWITILGNNPAKALVGETYIDAGATAEDTYDGNVTVEVSGEVDTDVPGIYTITYSATDNAGNTRTATRTVNVFPMIDGVIVDNYTTCLNDVGCEVKAEAMAIDGLGNIYVTGHSGYANWFSNSRYMVIWKYTSTGVLDTSFGTDGIVIHSNAAKSTWFYNDYGYGITLDSSGNVYVTGRSIGYDIGDSYMVIWKYRSTGVLDTSFGTDGIVINSRAASGGNNTTYDRGNDIVMGSSGNIYVTGSSRNDIPTIDEDMVVWKYDSNGNPVNSFGTNGIVVYNSSTVENPNRTDSGNAIAVDGSGNVYVTGNGYIQDERILIWSYDSDGDPVNSFGDNGIVVDNNVSAGDILQDGSGNIYVTSGGAVLKYTGAGVRDTTFGTVGSATIDNDAAGAGYVDFASDMVLDSSGNIYVAGTSSDNGDDSHMAIWKLTNTGVLDTSFGTNGSAVHQGSAGMDFENIGYGIGLDSVGNVHVLGTTYNASGEQYMVLWEYEAVSGGPGMTFVNNTSYPIPDGGGAGPGVATSEINVEGATDSITKVTVTLDIWHQLTADLTIELISPLGTTIVLSDVNIYYIQYTNTTFDDNAVKSITEAESGDLTGSYRPVEPLATFDGEDADGTWTLQIKDHVWTDEGTLNSWSITIE